MDGLHWRLTVCTYVTNTVAKVGVARKHFGSLSRPTYLEPLFKFPGSATKVRFFSKYFHPFFKASLYSISIVAYYIAASSVKSLIYYVPCMYSVSLSTSSYSSLLIFPNALHCTTVPFRTGSPGIVSVVSCVPTPSATIP